ncbi:hypothetical protein AM233_17985 [Bacillus sp. FJAT-22058]|nr:hypothetical protein AM233_17985 [Bacillus sp. FJAT-22058]
MIFFFKIGWLARCNKETKAIYIATYNFNFNKYEKSSGLRYLDGIAKTFRQTIPYQSILIGIIFHMQLYDEKYVLHIAFSEFVNNLHKLSSYCNCKTLN